jgi:hypothetical protein
MILYHSKHVPDIDHITNEEILTFTGNLWTEYLEDRTYLETLTPYSWSGDIHTIGYWPLDDDLLDHSGNGYHLSNQNFTHQDSQGFVGDAWRSSSTIRSYLNATDLFPYNSNFPLSSGTIDFLFKSDTDTQSGRSFPFFQITATGLTDSILLFGI